MLDFDVKIMHNTTNKEGITLSSVTISKRKRLIHVILGVFTTSLVEYNPNIKFQTIIDIVRNEVLYTLNNMRL